LCEESYGQAFLVWEEKQVLINKVMNEQIFDCVIVGAGIVGLSTAYTYIHKYPNHKLLILEKESKIFSHQSGRNSGVIHSGIYYKPGSYKARNCIVGYKKLISFAEKHSVPFEITGKLIVANDQNEIETLLKIYQYGVENGLEGIKLIDSPEIQKIEPFCTNAIKAIHVPQSGIIDYLKLGEKLLQLLKENDADIRFNTKVLSIKNGDNLASINLSNEKIVCKRIIMCNGVFSDKFISKDLKNEIRVFPFRGEYYKLIPDARHKVKGLIYPVPNLNFPFLGLHFTKTIHGDIEAGPNAVLALSREGYDKTSFNFTDFFEIISWKGFWVFTFKYWRIGFYEMYRSFFKKAFMNSLKTLIPAIKENELIPKSAGIRAQVLTYNGELFDDFLIDNNKRIVNVINAPSPAATSCFAIAEQILNRIDE
jgi:(S)-2-hydroxyglutarate dehydrogenase